MITVSTLLYQGNYSKILNENSWFSKYNPDYEHKKLIVVNNVQDKEYINFALSEYKNKFHVDYFFVEDFEKSCIDTFNLNIDKDKTIGYFYIIPYFALTIKLDTDYVFHVSEDCTKTINFDDTYVIDSINEIEKNELMFCTALSWGPKGASMGYDIGEWEQMCTFKYKNKVEENNEKYWYTVGFSDQVFVASKKKLMDAKYELNPSFVGGDSCPTCRGTSYCPESWERRVSEYMLENNMYRGVWKNNDHYYLHGK